VWAVDAIPADEVAEAEGDREETGDTWTPVSYIRHALLGPAARDAAPGARAADGESASVAEFLAVYEWHAQQVCGCPGCSSSASRSPTAPDGSAWSDYATNDAQVGAATQFGNDYVDGILYGTRWTGPLTYSFADSVADFGSPYPYTIGGLQSVTAMQQAATRAIFEGVSVGNTFAYGSFADVANIAITLAADPTGPSDLVIAEADTLDGNNIPTARVVDFPELDQRISGGDVLYGNDSGIYRTPLPGNFAWVTHIHEYGHALGLSHGHNGGGSIFDKTIPADRNAEEFSVMSYASIPGMGRQGPHGAARVERVRCVAAQIGQRAQTGLRKVAADRRALGPDLDFFDVPRVQDPVGRAVRRRAVEFELEGKPVVGRPHRDCCRGEGQPVGASATIHAVQGPDRRERDRPHPCRRSRRRSGPRKAGRRNVGRRCRQRCRPGPRTTT